MIIFLTLFVALELLEYKSAKGHRCEEGYVVGFASWFPQEVYDPESESWFQSPMPDTLLNGTYDEDGIRMESLINDCSEQSLRTILFKSTAHRLFLGLGDYERTYSVPYDGANVENIDYNSNWQRRSIVWKNYITSTNLTLDFGNRVLVRAPPSSGRVWDIVKSSQQEVFSLVDDPDAPPTFEESCYDHNGAIIYNLPKHALNDVEAGNLGFTNKGQTICVGSSCTVYAPTNPTLTFFASKFADAAMYCDSLLSFCSTFSFKGKLYLPKPTPRSGSGNLNLMKRMEASDDECPYNRNLYANPFIIVGENLFQYYEYNLEYAAHSHMINETFRDTSRLRRMLTDLGNVNGFKSKTNKKESDYSSYDKWWIRAMDMEVQPFDFSRVDDNDHQGYISVSMWLNYLSNSIANATNERLIQGTVGPFAILLYYPEAYYYGMREMYLVPITYCTYFVFILQLTFPMAVWRLSYERQLGLLSTMRTTGVNMINYICGMFIYDVVTAIIVGWLMTLLMYLLQVRGVYGNDSNVGDLFGIVVINAVAMTGFGFLLVVSVDRLPYLLTCGANSSGGSRSKVITSANVTIAEIIVLVSTLSMIFLLEEVFPRYDDENWNDAMALATPIATSRAVWLVTGYHEGKYRECFTRLLLVQFFSGVAYFVIALLLEENVDLGQILSSQKVSAWRSFLIGLGFMENAREIEAILTEDMDPDVKDEMMVVKRWHEAHLRKHARSDGGESREKVAAAEDYLPDTLIDYSSALIVLSEVHKIFNKTLNSPWHHAVQGVSFSVNKGDVFGLLGPNGAGKSTIISMMSGLYKQTKGEIFMNGKSIRTSRSTISNCVGICAQDACIWPELTVEDHLIFRAQVKGYRGMKLRGEVQRVAKLVQLLGDALKTKAGVLSGGMRRRLAIGMALVGSPQIIMLDEPSTGLDPENRDLLWSIIRSLRSPERAILLTTHLMEEADALCSRIAIMARGRLKCIGSPTHLKTRFGTGFKLSVNLKTAVNESDQRLADLYNAMINFVKKEVSVEAEAVSAVNGRVTLLLPQKTDGKPTKVSLVFDRLEKNKDTLGILEWSLSMASMEDVFVSAVEKDQV